MYSEEEANASIDRWAMLVDKYCKDKERRRKLRRLHLRLAERSAEEEEEILAAGRIFDAWCSNGEVKIDSAIRPGNIGLLGGTVLIFNNRSEYDRFFKKLGFAAADR